MKAKKKKNILFFLNFLNIEKSFFFIISLIKLHYIVISHFLDYLISSLTNNFFLFYRIFKIKKKL